MAPQAKLCPACQTPAALDATQCARCGHTFRTKFVADPQIVPPPPLSPAATTRGAGLNWGHIAIIGIVAVVIGLVTIGILVGDKGKRLNQKEQETITSWHKTKNGVYLNSEIDDADQAITDKADKANLYRHELIKVQNGTAELFTCETTREQATLWWKSSYVGDVRGETWKAQTRSVQFTFDGHGVLTADGKRYYKVPGAPVDNLEVILARGFHTDVSVGKRPTMEMSVLEGQEIP